MVVVAGIGVKHRDILTLVRTMAVFLLLLLFLPLIAGAQTSESSDGGDWIEPIDQQPETDPDWVRPGSESVQIPPMNNEAAAVIAAYAGSFDFDAKRTALRMLDQRLQAGVLGPEDPRALQILSFLALESYEHEIRRDGRIINDFPIVRAEAVRLLGAMGGSQAGLTVQRALTVETDTYVLAVAVGAAARTYSESGAGLVDRLTILVERMNAQSRPDNNLAQSVVMAVRDIHARAGRIDSPDLFRALISIAQGSYSYVVRQEALSVIDLLRRQDLAD